MLEDEKTQIKNLVCFYGSRYFKFDIAKTNVIKCDFIIYAIQQHKLIFITLAKTTALYYRNFTQVRITVVYF